MKDLVTRLKEKTHEFGNHYQKYIQAISKNLNQLIQRLEDKKKRDAVHILHAAYDFESELKIIASVGKYRKEKLDFIGTFFALQFLHTNRQAVDLLKMDILNSEVGKLSTYKKFMRNAGNNFRMLTTHYICELMKILMKKDLCPEFVILGVGTKSDQDDIDVGIIDDCTQDRVAFNRAIGCLSQEMFKFAISFHFHLSEHIGDNLYSASIDEYQRVLTKEISDYVIINEMLSAAVITGSKKLFRKYQEEITDRYFYHPHADNRYHEGYLRGILGEVCHLLEKPISSTLLNFKEDGLRVIKNIICAQKTIFNIDKVNAWDIIEHLKTADSKRSSEYNALDRALTFFEIFRYLYQLLVTQDEEVILDDTSSQNIRRVAKIIGYTDVGKCRAEQHILMHYYEHIQNTRRIIPVLVDDIKKHLRTCSTLTPIFNVDYPGNTAKDFVEKFRFFRGTSFWDDILDDLKAQKLLDKFVDDLSSLKMHERKNVVKQYIECFKYDFCSLVNLLIILGKNKSSYLIFKELNDYLIQNIDDVPDVVRNIAYVFNRFPNIINSYLALNDETILEFYQHILEKKIYEKEIAVIIEAVKNLIEMHLSSSLFFKRIFLKITDKYPRVIRFIRDPGQLRECADGFYSDIDSMPTFEKSKEELGNYYDCEMIRVGVEMLSGTPVVETNAEFTEFSDKYINTLFDICRREVDKQYAKRIIMDDLLAIFAAGGHAREQAYDDDYDMIVLLNSDNSDILSYCNKIISKMNNEIIKRGTIPHHRFSDYFGRFVVLLKEVDKLLSDKRPDIFIEKSQILGARLIIGSHRFEQEFFSRIVIPYIFNKKNDYINQMIEEIKSRHKTIEHNGSAVEDDIKETMGGLRDIEMIMLIIKAKFELKDPVNSRLFKSVASAQKRLAKDLLKLGEIFCFLNHLRNVYRLTAGASDIIMKQALNNAANIMGYKSNEELYQQFKKVTSNAKMIIADLIDHLQ